MTTKLKSPYPWFLIKRFWAKVDKSGDCWVWTASRRHKGYGAFAYTIDGKIHHDRAHRFSYEIHNGPIPVGMFVLHRCDNPACVNPSHLFLGTAKDNVDDMMSKGRHVPGGTYGPGSYRRGVAHHASRLNEEIVRNIRDDRDSGMSISRIAAKHGIALGHAHRIITRKSWSHVL